MSIDYYYPTSFDSSVLPKMTVSEMIDEKSTILNNAINQYPLIQNTKDHENLKTSQIINNKLIKDYNNEISKENLTYNFEESLEHSKKYREDQISKILTETFCLFDQLENKSDKSDTIIYLTGIENTLEKTWDILHEEDKTIALTITTIQNVLENINLDKVEEPQLVSIRKIVKEIVNQTDIDYYQFALRELHGEKLSTTPSIEKRKLT
jgi:hypothetical protein